MQLLYALQTLRTPWLDALMAAVTRLGEETVFMAAAIVVFWCISKRGGYYLLSVGFLGAIANQFLKMLFRIPRPWILDPHFQIVEEARAAATGYSFPSGHTQSAVGTFGGFARMTRRPWLRWLCIALAAAVGFSRMYLGVHTPWDVGVSVVLATVLVLLLWPVTGAAEEKPERMGWLLLGMTACGLAFLAFMYLFPFPADTDPHNLESALSGGWKMTGAMVGMLLAWWAERKWISFTVEAPWWAQILKVAVGLGLVLAIKSGLKAPLQALLGHVHLANAVRYGLLVLFAGALWPATFRWWQKLGKR